MPKHLLFPLLLLFFLSKSSQSFEGSKDQSQYAPNEFVEMICKRTSNCGVCSDAFYSDSRTQNADQYTVAYIAVLMAHTNATNTRKLIEDRLHGPSLPAHEAEPLQRCCDDYEAAISYITSAYVDVNDETFSDLPRLASMASASVDNCLAAFSDDLPLAPFLQDSIHGFKILLEACEAVGNLYCSECF